MINWFLVVIGMIAVFQNEVIQPFGLNIQRKNFCMPKKYFKIRNFNVQWSMDLRKGVLKLSDNVQKKHKLISYANGRSLA